MTRLLGACLAAALLPGTAWADPLTYADVLQRASATAPGNEAARLGVDAARAQARAAGELPDPRLAAGIDNFPISGPPAFRIGDDEMTMGRIGIEQDVPNLAKRRAARELAQADISAAEAARAAQARQVRLATGIAWIELYYAERRLAAIDAVLAEVRALAGSVPQSVASGLARPGQTLQVAQAIAGFEDRRDELIAAITRARATLSRWTGDPDPHPVGDPPLAMVDGRTLRANLDRHPDMLVAEASLRRADAGTDAARAEKRPDWGFDVAYQRRDPRFGDMVSAGLKVSLPLFTRNRQTPMIVARTSEAARAMAEREGVRRALASELDAGLADHVMHHAQWMRARDTLLPLARQRVELETGSYAARRASLVEVVEAQTMRADAELTVLDRETELARDAVRLMITYGSDHQ